MMNAEKPNFLSQPVVKNVFMYRNGDQHYEARRIVINQKRVCNFETLLREVTSGIQAPFGAVRNIYTPRGGHKVDRLESLQSGEQYVAAGRERFKKLDYLEIGPRKRRMLQALPLQVKPPPQNRIMVSARFLKPIKEPCPIFVVANGDVLNPAMRLLIHQRMLGQFDKILEMVTEKMGLRVLGGVRSLYTYEGQQVTDGNQLESGQLYVAVGRDKFKKLPYIDLLFSKPRGMRRMKAYSLPPIYRMSKQNGTGKSMVQSSDSGETDPEASPSGLNGNSKEHLSSIVREISQARLISLRKRRSGQSMALGSTDQDDVEGRGEGRSTGEDDLQNQTEQQNSSPNNKETAKGNDLPSDETPSPTDAHVSKDDPGEPTVGDEKQDSNEQENSPSDVVNNADTDEKCPAEESTSQGQGPCDKTLDSNEKEGEESSKGGQNDQDRSAEGVEEVDSGKGVNGSHDGSNDADTGEEQKEQKEDSNDVDKAQADNETKEAKSSDANREEEGADGNKDTEQSEEVNGEVSGQDDEVKSEAELDVDKKNPETDKEKE
ncbi:doublecortin domain-containing protein 2-like [Periophthalmus magnuspinnatus]|uniref:doublecortin domain-containing protein 2-like n=1 Tax=Periophthalmus magnuspinnatus TaxID=409849 RepID=UPI0024370221|nr:doublecortin domain-containing protein 2-like [Periophthalmus magnuspinnatus]